MRLLEAKISNFKGITHEEFCFKEEFNIIIGDNGIGKTSVLEALSVALGGFLGGIDGIAKKNFTNDEIRREGERMGEGSYNSRYITPICVECTAKMDGAEKPFIWKRQKNSLKASRTTIEPRDICRFAFERSQDSAAVLPVLSYQSVGRMWIQKRERSEVIFKDDYSRTVGYMDCLSEASDSKMLLNWFKKMEMVSWQQDKKIAEYEAVKSALTCFMSEMEEASVNRVFYDKRSGELVYETDTELLPIRLLSSGYQSMIWMVLDIAYRMSVLNPNLTRNAVIKTPGIVLIDELDLHLHPKWQWKIVGALKTTFPSVQFIATTHSPVILSSCKNENIICLGSDGEAAYGQSVYGFPVNDVLEGIQGSGSMPESVKKLFYEFYDLVEEGQFKKAEEILHRLETETGGNHPEIVSAKVTLDLEMITPEDET